MRRRAADPQRCVATLVGWSLVLAGSFQLRAQEVNIPLPGGDASAASPSDVLQPSPDVDRRPTPTPSDRLPVAATAPAKPAAKPQFPGPKTLPPTGPWRVLFFENDFSAPHDYVLGDELKNLDWPCGNMCLQWSTGGEIRHRYMDEANRLRPGPPVDTDAQLWRWRHYFDVHTGDYLRFYVEGLHADSFGEEAAPQAIDVNRWDLQNYFVDILLLESDTTNHTLRYGRQELLFGRQRLVSPLDWANIRRNFEGFRYLARGEDVRLDVFAVQPVNAATGYRSPTEFDNQFDRPNWDVWFAGAYGSYSRIENTLIEPYWLYNDVQQSDPLRPDGTRHTFGARVSHLIPVEDGCGQQQRVWDMDVEGAFQVGEDDDEDVRAGFVTTVLGHTWKQLPGKPRLSGLFYYGSGDRDPNDDQNNTFYVLFPLAHAYWGISDNLSGENLLDYSLQYDIRPTDKTAVTFAYHWFSLASSGDRAYNVAGAPIGAPGNSTDLGDALDIYGYYALTPNFDVQLGYSWFWYGQFIDQTTPRDDARQLYIQSSLRY